MRLALVPGVAAAQRDAELIGQIIGEIAVERRSLGAHVARGIAVEPRQPDQIAGQPQKHVERGMRGGQIGRASCRERVCQYVSLSVVDVPLKKNNIITRYL